MVDALVNNAGYYHMGPVEATTMEQVHDQFQTNVFGLIALTKAFLPDFREQRSGVIVNLASISADQGYPYTAVYAASKAAVRVHRRTQHRDVGLRGHRQGDLPGPPRHTHLHQDRLGGRHPRGLPGGHAAFFAARRPVPPGGDLDVIYQAVTDGRTVRPATTRAPMESRYPASGNSWVVLVLGGVPEREHRQPQPLWNALMPRGGDAVEMGV